MSLSFLAMVQLTLFLLNFPLLTIKIFSISHACYPYISNVYKHSDTEIFNNNGSFACTLYLELIHSHQR
ncbi:unnamed protein product [Adineta ricciae]|uniref:Secreted protein n=1 Tax=Adineta ricciae TaxID=249248 RepID=A0A814QVJ8_ADIRI|nr:unnamed protein product [Adineta ricciae]